MRMAVGMCALIGMVAGSGAGAFAQQPAHHWAIVVHGGAGVIEKSALGPEGDKAYREGLDRAIHAGAAVLDKGGSALDAVEATLHVFEEDPILMRARARSSRVKEKTRWTPPSWRERH